MKLIVGSGWYSSDKNPDYIVHGDDFCRGYEFRTIWWNSLKKYISPDLVCIVDSNSPVKYNEFEFDKNIPKEIINLKINPGHSQNTSFHYSGWMASVLLSIEYALLNDFDVYMYIEQDVLIYGNNFKNNLIDLLNRKKILLGDGKGTAWPIQQSVFAIHRDMMRKFISRIHSINLSDYLLSPEMKFSMALIENDLVFYTLLKIVNFKFGRNFLNKIFRKTHFFKDHIIPFGYGRTRPINFKDDDFYFQHGSKEEIEKYLTIINN